MFADPRPTPFDLRFRLLGVPVTVHPLFWLGAVVLGIDIARRLDLLLIWVACVFVGVLVHEMGHALAARAFGSGEARIWLLMFGGLAMGGGRLWARWQRIAFSLAGPAAGFLLLGGQVLLHHSVPGW